MKAIIPIALLVVGFYVFGVCDVSHVSLSPDSVDGWVKDVQSAFDPTWQENLKHSDLISILKAVAGINR